MDKNQTINKTLNNHYILFLIIIFSLIIDKIYISNTSYLPAWDQGYHLTNLFKTYNTFEEFGFNEEWWKELWSITETYRGPLTYILSSFFLKIFGKSYESSLLSNNIFSIITILCIYNLAKELGNKEAGLWGTLIFALNPYIFDQKIDYLIELSQVCFITLNFYILYKFIVSKGSFFLSLILGITLGFVFLTKPTGILFLAFTYIYTFYSLLINKIFYKKQILYIIIIFTFFLITIWPWLEINWLTIFTSLINSWQWGINYQDGLEANTWEGLFFYPKVIFKLIGPFIIGSFVLIEVLNIFKHGKKYEIILFRSKVFSKYKYFFLTLPINIIIVCTLMSTKDLRFILPIFPTLCIISGLFISNLKKYKWIRFYKIIIFAIIILSLVSHLLNLENIKISLEKFSINSLPHKEIIENTSNSSPNVESVIAVIPDTEELNTFNLSAEAELQNNNVYFRQVISNENSYKEDLNRFNWFLLKDGDQGIMSNDTKLRLSKLVKESNKFQISNSWELPDGTKAILYERKIKNESISTINKVLSTSELDLKFNLNNLSLNIKGNVENLSNSALLINGYNNEEKIEINIALPKILGISNKNIEIFKNINLSQLINLDESFKFNCNLISEQNKELPIEINKIIFNKNNNPNNMFEINKIEEVEKMGQFLKNGYFDKLFNLVGLINQTDPEQDYLKDAEQIFKYRYKLNHNVNYLYNIAIAQILQKKSTDASKTILEIIKIDLNNPNIYLAKSVVDIYNFNPREAEKNILIANKYNKNKELYSTIETIKIISDIINLRFKSFIKI